MSDANKSDDDLRAEFRALGKNLADAMRAAWESPERRMLQQEIEAGLSELNTTLRQEVSTFSQSSTGQQLKGEVEDFRQRLQNGEVQSKVREELLNAMRLLNLELQKASAHRPSDSPQDAASAPSTPPGETRDA